MRCPRSILCTAILSVLAAPVWSTPAPAPEPAADAAAEARRGGKRQRVQVLDKVHVEAQAFRPFAPDRTTTGLKSDADIRDVPAAVTVVPPAVIETQGATSLSEALRNVAGLTLASGEGGFTGDNITLRGFAARTDQYVDGVRDNGQYIRDTFNIERVEVLKGAASMQFGRGGTGGVVNSITKQPSGYPLSVLTLMGGSESLGRATVDIDQPIGDNAGVRLNLLYQDSDSFRDEVFAERKGAALSGRLDFSDATRVDASYFHLEQDGVLDYGLPFNLATGSPIDVDFANHYGAGRQSIQQFEVDEGRLRVEHTFASGASLRNTTAVGDYDRLYRIVRPNNIDVPVPTASTLISRNHTLRAGTQSNAFNVTDLHFDVDALGVRHEIYAGLELGREDFTTRDRAGLPALPAVPIFDPGSVVLPELPDSFEGAALAASSVVDTDTRALSVQDRIVFNDRWSVIAGVRQERFDATFDNRLTGQRFERKDDMTSYRLGAVFQPDEAQSWYATWSTSFNPSAETFGLSAATADTDPEENRNVEIGAKFTPWGPRLGLNVAVFRLEKTNARTIDPTNTTVQILDGRQRSDGIEVEVQGALTRNWRVFAGATWLDPEITRSNDINSGVPIEGNRPVNAARFGANLWSVYQLPLGFEVGAGAFHVGERFGNTGNTLSIASYTRFDAYVGWNEGPWRVALNAYNVGDKRYFDFATGVFATPGAPRNYRLSVSYAF